MKIVFCPNCADIHAKNVVDMYKDLKTPVIKIREEKDQNKAKGILDRHLHDAITLGFYKEHGPINIEIVKTTMHILDKNNKWLCSNTSALNEVKKWKGIV